MPTVQGSWYVQVHSVKAGACKFRVTRMGANGSPSACAMPTETNYIHYQIMNPLP